MLTTLRTLSIRTKLMWIVLALLVIPWMGYHYVLEMKRFLVQGQKDALLLTAAGIVTSDSLVEWHRPVIEHVMAPAHAAMSVTTAPTPPPNGGMPTPQPTPQPTPMSNQPTPQPTPRPTPQPTPAPTPQ